MTKHSGGATINQGRVSKPPQAEPDAEFEVGGQAEEQDEAASPAEGRKRAETGRGEEGCPVDLDAAHDRAS